MTRIKLERAGTLARLRLAGPRANALNQALLTELLEACGQIQRDGELRGVLLCSSHPRIFCPGLDLVDLMERDRAGVRHTMQLFAQVLWALLELQKPTLAAMGGHALAGGCILALAANLRILAEGGPRLGLAELKLGVALPWTAALLLKEVIPAPQRTALILEGRTLEAQAALAAGLVQETAPKIGFEAFCEQRLVSLADKDPLAFALSQGALQRDLLARMRAEEESLLEGWLDCWFQESTQERIQAQVASLQNKPEHP